MKNISKFLYNFIEENTKLFDLKQYNVDHSINIELLNRYISKQSCSKKYFDLIKYIYTNASYIDCDTFIDIYTSNIIELDSMDREIIVVFPYLQLKKSNFFLTLYFLYLYNATVSKKINYVFSYDSTQQSDTIDISKLEIKLNKPPIIVICDDFLYTGSQLSVSIANLPIICTEALDIYACICGMTQKSQQALSDENITKIQLENIKKAETNGKIQCYYNVHLPTKKIFIKKTLKTVIRDKMMEDEVYNDTIEEKIFIKKTLKTVIRDKMMEDEVYNDTIEEKIFIKKTLKTVIRDKMMEDGVNETIDENSQIHNYINLNDMYILTVINNKLIASSEFTKLYYKLDTTMIYLFFKYPDFISTVLTMCVLNNYSNNYTIILDKLRLDDIFKKKGKIKKIEITQDLLFDKSQNLEEIKQNIKNSKDIDTIKFDWVQKCSDFNMNDVKIVDIDTTKYIELIHGLKPMFDSIETSLCNGSIETFYKQPEFNEKFTALSNLIKNIITGGDFTIKRLYKKPKKYNKSKKTNKSKKYNKSKKGVKILP
jgi:hypothetical protein